MFQPLFQIPVIGMELEAFVVLLIAALAGGAFGAALGALPAFVFTGFVVFLGEGLAVLEGELGGLDAVGAGNIATGITGTIGFGAVTGPHIAFAGGVAATAYAGRKYPEMEPDDWDYHFGKNILYAFGTKPDILAVGAIFGAVGMLFTRIMGGVGFPTDNIALSVVATAFLARLAFGYPLVGRVGGSSILDMSPFEHEEKRVAADGGTETGSIFMGYAISAMSLLFLNLGVEKIPVTHHITLLGSTGAVIAASAVGSDPIVLLVAGAFGAISGLLGELSQRVFYSHSGTHVDPPAMAIAAFMFVLGILYLLGLLPNAGYLAL